MYSSSSGYNTVEITTELDPAWKAWKEIYYASFPESERMSEAYFEQALKDNVTGKAAGKHIMALRCRDAESNPVCIAYYEHLPESSSGYLLYLATGAEHRNKGYGAILYKEICRKLTAGGANALVFEVEIPEHARENSVQGEEFAQRRIDWYRRLGAQLLEGIRYYQEVDTGQPPIEMALMIHQFSPMTAEQAYDFAAALFGKSLEQIGKLALVGAE